jgi:hypothetical protein
MAEVTIPALPARTTMKMSLSLMDYARLVYLIHAFTGFVIAVLILTSTQRNNTPTPNGGGEERG